MCAWIVELDDTSVKNFADDAEAVVVVVVVAVVVAFIVVVVVIVVVKVIAIAVDAAAVALLFHVYLLCFHFSLKKNVLVQTNDDDNK